MRMIVMGCLLAASLSGCYNLADEEDRRRLAAAQEESKFGHMDDRERAAWKTLVDACPGLSKYRDDWKPVKTVLATPPNPHRLEFKMADRLREMSSEYAATGHWCLAAVGGDRPDRIAVTKRPCVKACLDRNVDVPGSTEIEIQ